MTDPNIFERGIVPEHYGGDTMRNLIGRYGFIAGLIVSAIIALFGTNLIVSLVLVTLGLLVGLMNISGKEAVPFLVSVIALVVGGTSMLTVFEAIVPAADVLFSFLQGVVLFAASAAVPVAFRGLFSTMHNR